MDRVGESWTELDIVQKSWTYDERKAGKRKDGCRGGAMQRESRKKKVRKCFSLIWQAVGKKMRAEPSVGS